MLGFSLVIVLPVPHGILLQDSGYGGFFLVLVIFFSFGFLLFGFVLVFFLK